MTGIHIARPHGCLAFVVVAVVFAGPLVAQDPGNTKPTLEALVGNSTEISTVRVKSIRLDDENRKAVQLELQVVDSLKRPWQMPICAATDGGVERMTTTDDSEAGEAQWEPTGVVSLSEKDLENLRYYNEGYWSVDLSSPIDHMLPRVLGDWKKQQSQLLLFQGFQSVQCGPLYFLFELDRDEVVLADWTVLSSGEAIRQKIGAMVDGYRGVSGLRLVLLDVLYFAPVVRRLSGEQDVTNFDARAILVPADTHYEQLLLEQIKHPEFLHDDNHTMNRQSWLKYTRDIYPFFSQQNQGTLRALLRDPQIGQQQRVLLEQILTAWISP